MFVSTLNMMLTTELTTVILDYLQNFFVLGGEMTMIVGVGLSKGICLIIHVRHLMLVNSKINWIKTVSVNGLLKIFSRRILTLPP